MSDRGLTAGRTYGGWLAAALALGVMLFWASRGWHRPGMSGHEFRQSQTALTAQIMAKQGFRLDYETPVLGKPWSIPMEFPAYQWLVAKTANGTGWGIIESGRWIALLAFVAGLPAWWKLGRMAGYSGGASALLLVPVMMAPVYVFYSRTVMIESFAWSSGAWFLWAVLRYRQAGTLVAAVRALVIGALAVLVKGTTWAVFCLPWAGVFLVDLVVCLRRRDGLAGRLLVQGGLIGLPLLALGFAWVAWGDHLKGLNPVAHFLLSGELREFNFGTVAARGDVAQWRVLGDHVRQGLLPLPLVAVALVAAVLRRRTRALAGLGLLAFIGGPLVFFNLYLLHDYYFYANGAFLCVLVGLVAAEYWDGPGAWWRSGLPAVVLVGVTGAYQNHTYRSVLLPNQLSESSGDYAVTRLIRELTDPEDVVVVHSPGWSSSLPFYAQRRMLTIPDSQMFHHPDRVRESINLLADESVPLLVVMRESQVQSQWTSQRIDQLKLWPVPLLDWESRLSIYGRAEDYAALREQVRKLDMHGVNLHHSEQLLPEADRVPLAHTETGEAVKAKLGIDAIEGVVPFGYQIVHHEGREHLLVHAVTEMFFEVPEGATTLEMAYLINPYAYTQRDFDGVCLLVEGMVEGRITTTFWADWLSPFGKQGYHTTRIALPQDGPRRIVLRLLAGPGDNIAFDQLWLRSFRFE